MTRAQKNKKILPVEVICNWQLPINFSYYKPIKIYVDQWPSLDKWRFWDKSLKILYLCEPDEISHLHNKATAHWRNFFHIFTHDEKVLKQCPNTIFFPFGTTWIRNYTFPKKKFGVSTVVGAKKTFAGHRLRHKLWLSQNRITISKKFFVSSRDEKPFRKSVSLIRLGESKDPLFDYQFHIAIENIRKNNWFTEKLIDCLQTKTVPLYWGCPNLKRFFNPDGIIQFRDIKELISQVNALTPKTYQSMKKVIEQNYKLSFRYANLAQRFTEKLEKLLYHPGKERLS